MPKLRLAPGLALLAGLFLGLAACESSPCVGEQCPEACNGAGCDGAGATPGGVAPSGRYTKCSSDSACDGDSGFSCVAGTCLYACRSHFDCAGVGPCTDFPSGQFCAPSSDAPPLGQYYTSCPDTTECDAEAGFECIGAGPGDLDAYCSTSCGSDTDCPTGFQCDRVGVVPCEDVCDVTGDAEDPECVPASEIGEGKKYQCGITGPEHAICVRRRFCAECESDEDCRSVAGNLCARDADGNKICTQACDESANACPWGNAAVCGVWDSELGFATCSHRFGACRGTGAPCEPCVKDDDCGRTGLCYGSSFTGERYCVDLSLACSCDGLTVSAGTCSGGGCPDTPGGLTMLCYVGTSPSNPGICIGANANENPLLNSPQTGCWPPL